MKILKAIDRFFGDPDKGPKRTLVASLVILTTVASIVVVGVLAYVRP